MTVIVGPNNAGKSRLLREIRDYLCGNRDGLAILNSVALHMPPTYEELNQSYSIEELLVRDRYDNWRLRLYSNRPTQPIDNAVSLDQYYSFSPMAYGFDWRAALEGAIQDADEAAFLRMLEGLFVQYMGTEEKLLICKAQHDYGMGSEQQGFLSSIKFDGLLLSKLREKVNELFGCDIVLDYSTLGDRIVFRVSNSGERIDDAHLDTEHDARDLYLTDMLDNQGDGLKSFVSTFLSLNMSHGDVLLIDEPESFLHPPLARQLGELIGEASGNGKKIVVATHSVDILKGILSKNDQAGVLRITQVDGVGNTKRNKVKVIDYNLLNKILQSPLLRVSRVLEGIFCERVILTEAEADELVYQELINKVTPFPGLQFVHGQNKQSLAEIAEIYRSIGIKFEVVVDFDILRVGKELKGMLEAIGYGEDRIINHAVDYANKLRALIDESIDKTSLQEKELEDACKKKRDKVYHELGASFFDPVIESRIKKTLKEMSERHLHILESGELETLFVDDGLAHPGDKHKGEWIPDALSHISQIAPGEERPIQSIEFARSIVATFD